jgi:hypothetical protein
MHNFIQWCEEKQNDLGAVLKDVEKIEGETKDENRVRTGLRGVYPDGYYRSQYPDLYNTPYSASAPLDMQNAKKTKSKADVGKTPL